MLTILMVARDVTEDTIYYLHAWHSYTSSISVSSYNITATKISD